MIYPVILSGGSGTRLWPLSRATLPKQFLSLASKYTLFQETVLRLKGISDMAAPLVICNNQHRFLAAEQLLAIHTRPLLQILEPEGRNTAPAVAIAAFTAIDKDREAVLLVMPADHLIQDVSGFHQAVHQAYALAREDKLVTFGVKPNEPNTGFGYIERGKAVETSDGTYFAQEAYTVERFVEKPDMDTANKFLASGKFFWNSGMFVFKASVYLTELQTHRPDIYLAALQAWEQSTQDLDFCRLNEKDFLACPSESIDYAVMERTNAAVMVTVDIGWSDVGSWSSLSEVTKTDAQGNALHGDIYAAETKNSYIRAENRMVAAIGVRDLVIVETADVVLVMHKSLAQNVKQAVEYLKQAERTEHLVHKRAYRPWGYYEGIDSGERFQVKRIMVKPGAKLSSQMHYHRAEHWIVVSGTAKITCGNKIELLHENQSTYIPIGETHRLENIGKLPLFMIEVQSGSYLGEDDIVRFEDDYKRA
jgi:mannose-1-phosphate guanylyltransferase/mannose-6-phosphate isomerase